LAINKKAQAGIAGLLSQDVIEVAFCAQMVFRAGPCGPWSIFGGLDWAATAGTSRMFFTEAGGSRRRVLHPALKIATPSSESVTATIMASLKLIGNI